MADLILHVEGENRAAAANALDAFLSRRFGRAPERQRETAASGSGQKDPATVIAAAALVLALPGAVKDGLDIAERIGLLDKLRELIGLARKEQAERGVTIRIETAAGLKDLTVTSEGEALDAVIRLDPKQR